MKAIGGLAALREKYIRESCVITGKVGVSMTPAIVKLTRSDGAQVEMSGMVSSNVKKDKRYAINGVEYVVTSIIRKGVELTIQKNRNGVLIAGAVNPATEHNSASGSMSPESLLAMKASLRDEARKDINYDALIRIVKARSAG